MVASSKARRKEPRIQVDAVELFGFVAATLVFSSFCMKRMVALRLTAIASNVAFIAYAALGGLTPILFLHVVLLPLNSWRTLEILRLQRRVRRGVDGHAVAEWLKPYARSLSVPAGAVIFRKGDAAERIYFIVRGAVRINEIDVVLHGKAVFGEMGMFSAARVRTRSACALEATELLWVGEDDLTLICHQHPGLTLHLMRLVTQRLLADRGAPTVTTSPAIGAAERRVRG